MKLTTSRRQFLTTTFGGATAGIAGCSALSSTDDSKGASRDMDAGLPKTVGLETVTSGLNAPLAVEFSPDADRRYIAERDGRIYVHEADGLRDELFLDLRDSIAMADDYNEQGLLGMALHPDFAEDRRIYLRYSAPRRPEMRSEYTHRFVVAEFEATADGRRAKPDSERTVLEIPEPRPIHNAGDLTFGPDGYLYIAVGDSGQRRNGQDVTANLLGSILRIDVDERPAGHAYAIPDDNPLVDQEGLDEHYAWGFRNPWRISFDGSDFYVADVGQSSFEEVNLVEKGGNYGWDIKEGTHCFKAEECPDETSESVRGGESLLDPTVEYPNSAEGEGVSGISVIGGHVYRGSTLSALDGTYIFGDFVSNGRLFAATHPDGESELSPTTVIDVGDGAEKLTRLLALGRDNDGEVYVVGTGAEGGGLFQIVPAT